MVKEVNFDEKELERVARWCDYLVRQIKDTKLTVNDEIAYVTVKIVSGKPAPK